MDDPSQYSISRAAKAGLPIFFPWQRESRRIMSCFDSTAIEAAMGPWKSDSPFGRNARNPTIYQSKVEVGATRDVDGHSGSHTTASEHLSGSLSLGVGNAVAKMSVTGSYDRSLQDMATASRASRNSSCRCGRIVLADDPPLSSAAIDLLTSEDGPQLFTKHFGDYFVSGYVLGADAGGCLAASSTSSRESETTAVKVNVKALWLDYTTSTSTTTTHETSNEDLIYCGYDTLDEVSLSLHIQPGETTHNIRVAASKYMAMANALHQRLSARLQHLGIKDNATPTVEQCSAAMKAGVVVELILVPFTTLRDYIRAIYEEPRSHSANFS